ncbi:MAG: hypothetical protein ACREBS_01065 [Nitrososphaerales archaeon]
MYGELTGIKVPAGLSVFKTSGCLPYCPPPAIYSTSSGGLNNNIGGTINNENGGVIYGSLAPITNMGTINNYYGGTLETNLNVQLINGYLGTINNCGLIDNYQGALVNSGNILNGKVSDTNSCSESSVFANGNGDLLDWYGGNFTSYGTISNVYSLQPTCNCNGTIDILGVAGISAATIVTNYGVIYNMLSSPPVNGLMTLDPDNTNGYVINECTGAIYGFSDYRQQSPCGPSSTTTTTTSQTMTTSTLTSSSTSVTISTSSTSTSSTTTSSTSTSQTSTTTTTTTSAPPECDGSTASSCTTSTTLQGGSADIDQMSTTGVYVQISGSSAPDGTLVTVASSDLSGQPSGTGNVQLGGESFYDVQVSQNLGSGAFATICINSSNISETNSMEYWNGTSWVNAYDLTTSGNTICGTMPTSALTGTPIVIGSPPVSRPPPAMVDGNVTIYSSTDNKGEILFTANATISSMHSSPFTESALPKFGTLPNDTYGYLGYYQGTFAAVSGGQKGANVSITVTYGGVTQTGYAQSPGFGNVTNVSFVFNATDPTQNTATSQSLIGYLVILGLSLPFIGYIIATSSTDWLSMFKRLLKREIRLRISQLGLTNVLA